MSHIVEDAATILYEHATRGIKRSREEDIDMALEIRKQAREHRRQSRVYIGQMREQVQLAYESALIQLHQSAAADAREEALDAREEALDASESDFNSRVEVATMLLSLRDTAPLPTATAIVIDPVLATATATATTTASKPAVGSPEFTAQVEVYGERIRRVLPANGRNILTVWIGYHLVKSPDMQPYRDLIMRKSREALAKAPRWDILKPLMKTIPYRMRLPALQHCGRLCPPEIPTPVPTPSLEIDSKQIRIMAGQVFQCI